MENNSEHPVEQVAQTPACYTISNLFNPEARRDTSVEFHSWHEVNESRAERNTDETRRSKGDSPRHHR
ncbi:MAG: hypothetical protein DBY45_09105 [Clostridiales bacterium]|nr:MAG: hypothetical protein DBY45_09105 [Clostridiales bacterium]